MSIDPQVARRRAKFADILVGAGLSSRKVLRALDYPRARAAGLAVGGKNGCIARIESEGWRTGKPYPQASLHCVKGTDCTGAEAEVAEESGPLLADGELDLKWKAGKNMMPMVRCDVKISLESSFELTGDANFISENEVNLYGPLIGDGDQGSGSISWDLQGIPHDYIIDVIGLVEQENSGFDVIQVIADGVTVLELGGDDLGLGDTYTTKAGSITGTAKNTLLITAGTGDSLFNIGVYWNAFFTIESTGSSSAHFHVIPPTPWPIPKHLEVPGPLSR